MKISTRTRYGTRFLLHLATHGGTVPLPLSDIARKQNISFKYLSNIASVLKSAGIVKTTVGAGGGFILAQPPELITIYDVFTLFDGALNLVHCVRDAAACRRSPRCVARDVWQEVNSSMEKSMRSITIADMMRKATARTGRHGRRAASLTTL